MDNLLRKAQNGDGDAQAELGRAYLFGEGIDIDYTQALYWLNRSIQNGSLNGYNNMGNYYLDGPEKDRNEEKAIYYYKIAADKGFINSMFNLASLYTYSEKNADYNKAKYYSELIYEKGDPDGEASSYLGWRCLGELCPEEKNLDKAIRYFRESVDKGNINALYMLGKIYAYGEGIEKNEKLAFSYISQAAEKGDIGAIYELGKWYEKGIFVTKNLNKAMEYYLIAADKGNRNAQVDVARYYFWGNTGVQDDSLSEKYAMMAAQQGDAHGEYILALIYKKQNKMELYNKWLYNSAQHGCAFAQLDMGCLCRDMGEVEDAFNWFYKAAKKGNEQAYEMVGLCYMLGIGVEKDSTKAYQIFKQLTEEGYPDAYYDMGNYYREEENNLEKAFQYYKEGAKVGSLEAKHNMAVCYEEGWGVKRDINMAISLYKELVDEGYSDAAVNLSAIYSNHLNSASKEEVNKDDEKSIELLIQAAESGDAQQQMRLAITYTGEYGNAKNPEKFLYWITKSIENGWVESIRFLATEYVIGDFIEKNYKKAIELFERGIQYKSLREDKVFLESIEFGMQEKAFRDMVSIELLEYLQEKDFFYAEYFMACRYREGNGVHRDFSRYIELLECAVKKGVPEAKNDYALELYKGKNIEQNKNKAVMYLEELNDINALYNLVTIYQNDPEYKNAIMTIECLEKIIKLETNEQRILKAKFQIGYLYCTEVGSFYSAFPYVEECANAGVPEAQYNLGQMYYAGNGTEKNIIKARYWWKLSAEQGYQRAKQELSRTESELGIIGKIREIFQLF